MIVEVVTHVLQKTKLSKVRMNVVYYQTFGHKKNLQMSTAPSKITEIENDRKLKFFDAVVLTEFGEVLETLAFRKQK